MTGPTLDLAMVGNCQIASLIDRDGTHVWTCWPRFDGDPMFCDLLAGSETPGRAGRWAIELIDQASSTQTYERNTAIVETTLADKEGASLVITDFCPRFRQYERNYRPAMLVRIISARR
jgi:GH15 family glucan-1,4-alpha-glucosidase